MARLILTSLLTCLPLLALGWAPYAFADDDTMMVVEEGATPDDIVNIIELPTRASVKAGQNVGRGQDTAGQA